MKKPSDVIRGILEQIIKDYTGSIEVEEIMLDLIEKYGKALQEEIENDN